MSNILTGWERDWYGIWYIYGNNPADAGWCFENNPDKPRRFHTPLAAQKWLDRRPLPPEWMTQYEVRLMPKKEG